MYSCKKAYYEKKERLSKTLDCKDSKFPEKNTSRKFNGTIISSDNCTYSVKKLEHIKKLRKVDENSTTTAEFVAEGYLGA